METNTTDQTTATGEQIICRTDRIIFKQSAIHGRGGFAAVDIPSGTPIIRYIGEKITKAESLRRCENENEYIFELDATHDLDGNVEWNPARLINHSCAPNCESELDEDKAEIWILALRDIRAGEELTFNYCYGLEDFEEHLCRCGAGDCVGYMVADTHFEHVRQARRQPVAGVGAKVEIL
jgi:uncharacterized protein